MFMTGVLCTVCSAQVYFKIICFIFSMRLTDGSRSSGLVVDTFGSFSSLVIQCAMTRKDSSNEDYKVISGASDIF